MIIVGGESLLKPPEGLGEAESKLCSVMLESGTVFRYATPAELRFELKVRVRLVEAAQALSKSGVRFAVFQDSRCNDKYWKRTEQGGFELLPGTEPSAGIRNIFEEGKKYAFECATAAVIVLYKGFLDVLGDRLFNAWFGGILLHDWKYDEDLRLVDTKKPAEALPGDVQYFKNPDVAADQPMWQGENVIRLFDGRFYGHGMGIKTEDEVIRSLNRKRKPGAERSAYMTDIVVRPDYPSLYRALIGTGEWGESSPVRTRIGPRTVTAVLHRR